MPLSATSLFMHLTVIFAASTRGAAGLELVGDDERLAAHAGLLPFRLLAEGTGLRAGLSAAMRRRGSSPLYDRGQLLADLALVLIAGGEAISDFQALAHLAPLIGLTDGVAGPVEAGICNCPAQHRRGGLRRLEPLAAAGFPCCE